jgi:di/tricarboxylate transporter
MSDATIALLVLGAVIALFMWNRFPVGIVALATALSLWATGLLTFNEAVSGFGDPVVIFIATLFVVSEGIDSTGLTTWAGQRLLAVAGEGRVRLLVSVMLLCALLTALISLNGSVAALLPMVVMLALRTGRSPSRMLMPMVYAGSAGSLLVLMGSPVNVIVSEAADDAGAGTFGFFEFGAVGLPILVGTIVLGVVLSDRLLPERTPAVMLPDLSRHADTLATHYDLRDGFYRLRVRERSPLLGLAPGAVDLSAYPGATLIGMQAGVADPRPVRHQVDVDDVLVVAGSSEVVSRLAMEQVLAVAMTPVAVDGSSSLIDREAGTVEVVVPPRSPLVGETVFPGMLRRNDLVILAVQRYGRDRGQQPTTLVAGDSLLLYGAWPRIDALVDDRDVLVVDSPDVVRRQAAPLGPKATRAALIVAGMVVLLAFGLVPPAAAGLFAAMALVLTNVLTSQQAYRAVSWETVVLVGGLIPLSTAIQSSGAADQIADRLVDVVGSGSPVLMMIALFVLTSVLGLVISNTATVLIVLPVVLAAAQETDVSVRPMLMLLAVAASAALLTPVQTPGNLMVMTPGGYKFSDYARLGLPLVVLWLVVAIVVIPFVWPF